MPELVACPGCGYKVQMAEALIGRQVRCQSCSRSFVAAPDTRPPEPPPAPPVYAGGSLGTPRPRRASLPRKRGERPPIWRDLVPGLDDGNPPFCPGCGKSVGWESLRCPFCGEEFEPELGQEPLRHQPDSLFRRDSVPHRARLIVALGNICLVLGGLSICLCGLGAIVSVPLGIVTWVMANHDLAQMRTGALDVLGKDLTETGRTGAILGIVLGLLFAACHAVWWLELW
jgi:hypothetical protein